MTLCVCVANPRSVYRETDRSRVSGLPSPARAAPKTTHCGLAMRAKAPGPGVARYLTGEKSRHDVGFTSVIRSILLHGLHT